MDENDNNFNKLTFEEALKRLEDNVIALEKGDIGLDDAIKIYEEGIKYSNFLIKKLDFAEKKVEELTAKNNSSGEKLLSTAPLDGN